MAPMQMWQCNGCTTTLKIRENEWSFPHGFLGPKYGDEIERETTSTTLAIALAYRQLDEQRRDLPLRRLS
jgi:hypothetical protein